MLALYVTGLWEPAFVAGLGIQKQTSWQEKTTRHEEFCVDVGSDAHPKADPIRI